MCNSSLSITSPIKQTKNSYSRLDKRNSKYFTIYLKQLLICHLLKCLPLFYCYIFYAYSLLTFLHSIHFYKLLCFTYLTVLLYLSFTLLGQRQKVKRNITNSLSRTSLPMKEIQKCLYLLFSEPTT